MAHWSLDEPASRPEEGLSAAFEDGQSKRDLEMEVTRNGDPSVLLPQVTAGLDVAAVRRGLGDRPRQLSSSYFYDAEGSRLFQRIMELPEYYLTRVEREILEAHGAQVASVFADQKVVVVDLGAGDGSKTAILLSALLRRCAQVRYAAVDVSAAALKQLQRSHQRRFPGIAFSAHLGDYASGLCAVQQAFPDEQKLALFLGSNIGNLLPQRARALLAKWRRQLDARDHLLIGFDLVKDPRLLQAAYDDAQGVTAAFNLNLLKRLNRELAANFDLSGFLHHACFEPHERRMESYLISQRRQVVELAGESVVFEPWEAIRTEVSYKYREADAQAFASTTGFSPVASYYDSQRWFLDALWRADGAI
jgi:dimethylhistidine N-methyltransferase